MGTTIVCLAVAGDRGIIGHVGDSRLILARRGDAFRLTEDHTLIGGMVKAGELTWDEARKSPLRGVLTRSIGLNPTIQVEYARSVLRGRDIVIQCSDGLHGCITEHELGDTADLAAFQAPVVIGADPRQRRDLLAPQARHPPPAEDGQAGLPGRDPRAPAGEKLGDVVGGVHWCWSAR